MRYYGMLRPMRPCPRDFRETYLQIGWDGIEDHYHANSRCIARWVEESGGEELRRARSAITRRPPQPQRRSTRYSRNAIAQQKLDNR